MRLASRSEVDKPAANYTFTRVTETPVTGPDPAIRKAVAQASSVAPVVATSSINRID